MIDWKNNNILPIAIASVVVGTIIGGVWYFREAHNSSKTSSFNNQIERQTQPVLTSQGNEQTTITLLADTFSGYSTFRTNEFREALSGVGIHLKYQNQFAQAKRAELLNQNNADLYVTTLDQFLKQKPQGKIVGLVDRTVGADAVVLNTKKYPHLKSVQDLEKLKPGQYSITYAADTPSEYLALVLDTKFEAFKLSDFNKKTVADASDAWKQLQDSNQNLAFAILWEPYVTMAKKQGYTVALSSQDAPTAIVDIIVASDRLINSKPQVVSDFLEAYYRRIDQKMREPALMKEQIASDGKLTHTEAESVVQGIDFFTAVEAKKWMSDGTLLKRMGAVSAVLALSGKLEKIPENFHQLYDSRFVESAVKNTESLIALVRADSPELADKLSGQSKAVNQKVSHSQEAIGNLQVRGEIQFTTSSAFLTAAGRQTIKQLAQEIQEFNRETIAVQVIGHTSKTGDSAFNKTLSDRRAKTVAEALFQAGVKHKIVAIGKGDLEPLPGISPSDPRNQRTLIRLVRLN